MNGPTPTGLSLRDVSVAFGATLAVSDVTLDVAAGEVLALVGPSGCGKSTLLRTIAGLESPDNGTVHWAGGDLSDVPPHERDVGLMFQDHALFAHRSVAENIEFGLRMRSVPAGERRRRVSELIELVGLPASMTDRNVESLSGGEAQRVALARALAPQPRLLLLDEPLGALDRALRSELVDELRVLLRELGQTTIHVTHDQDEAFALADRVAVMSAGRVRRVGSPAEIWNDPQSAFVAEFVGHIVDTVDGRLVAVRPDAVAIAEGDHAGPAEPATVTDVRFVGDRSLVICRTATGATRRFHTPEPPTVGAQVRLVLDPERLAVVAHDRDVAPGAGPITS